jgi:hypothetical protein
VRETVTYGYNHVGLISRLAARDRSRWFTCIPGRLETQPGQAYGVFRATRPRQTSSLELQPHWLVAVHL